MISLFTIHSITNIYTLIETGGEQLQIEPRRFYDIHHFSALNPEDLNSNTRMLIYQVLLICNYKSFTLIL